MDEKALLKKLNNLKQIAPDQDWKKSCRDILYSQISAGDNLNRAKSNLEIIWETVMPARIILSLAKPVWLTTAASFVLMAAVIGGVYASKNTKPGDSLYIAKIVSEKAQYAMAFNEKDKAALSLEFAANRAKEIAQVLKDSEQGVPANQEKVQRLSEDFKKEISQAKSRLNNIKKSDGPVKDEETEVFGANLGKNNQRMEIVEPAKPAPPVLAAPKPLAEAPAALNASSTALTVEADKMFKEAEKMFNEKNYDGTINKLAEINKAINQADSGQVKGASETASTTVNN